MITRIDLPANNYWSKKPNQVSPKNQITNKINFTANKAKVSSENLKAYFLQFKGKILKHDTREWLETNGGGAYSSSTVSGANTRVYHGTLVASKNQPVDRTVLLSRIDEEIDIKGKDKTYFSEVVYGKANLKRGGNSGEEVSNIKSFKVLPTPTWEYDLGNNTTLTKQIAMPHDKGKGTVVIGYSYNAPENSPEITLSLRPIFNQRDFHSNQNSVSSWHQDKHSNKIFIGCSFGDHNLAKEVALTWNNPDAQYETTNNNYGNYYYQREDDRGLGSFEHNLYNPGVIKVTLKPGDSISLTTSTEDIQKPLDIETTVKNKNKYLQSLYDKSGLPQTETFKLLQRAADQFIVHRNSVNGPTILAGYHWFNDWGRDTMIALPGCTLTTNRLDEAKGILTTFGKYVKNGMLPNNFPNNSGAIPGYNTSDASMWWFNALNSYIEAAGNTVDKDFIKDQYQKLKEVVNHHVYGRHNASELIALNNNFTSIVETNHPKNTCWQWR